MKSGRLTIITIAIAMFFMGCSAHSGHPITSNAQLTNNNFKYIRRTVGSAQAVYLFGVIKFTGHNLYDLAKIDMLRNADLKDSTKAVINITTDVTDTWYLLFRIKKVFMSGEVVEFTK